MGKLEFLLKEGYKNSAMLGREFGRKEMRPSEFPKELLEKAKEGSIRYRGGLYFHPSVLPMLEEFLKKDRIEKTIFVSRLRYGVDWYSKSEEVKNKQQQTNLTKYGVLSTTQIPEVREKQVDTLMKHFGVVTPAKSRQVAEMISESHLSKHISIEKRSELFHGDRFIICSDYKGESKNIIIYCEDCGYLFSRKARNINADCPYCMSRKSNKQLFIAKAMQIHGDKYDYSESIYVSNKLKIKIFCKKCKKYFYQRPNDHLSGHGHCISSRQEEEMERILERNNLKYFRNYTFEDCKFKRLLPFDFFLPDYDLLIEIQGEQHFKDKWGELKNRQMLDKIKKDYAEKYHSFLEIPYWEKDMVCLMSSVIGISLS